MQNTIFTGFVVAPLVGAWIEITIQPQRFRLSWVAPLVGAWIEIFVLQKALRINLVAPLVGAWIEILKEDLNTIRDESLPSWERGLKLSERMVFS